jgi:peptidoglycan/LPS O-acetylase OafA/YrhL
MRRGNAAYIERLDHLRFFAAALVLLFHAWLVIGGATHNIRQIPIINQGQVSVQYQSVYAQVNFSNLTQPAWASGFIALVRSYHYR